MRPALLLRTTLAFLIGTAGVMHGQQTNFPFQILVTTPTTSNVVPNGASIGFLAEVGQSQTAHIIATYQGVGTVQISQPPVRFGSPSFTVTVAGTKASGQLPATLNPGDNIAFDAVFKPSSTLQVSAQLVQAFIEIVPSGSGLQNLQNSISLNLIGTAPSFTFSYILQSDQNVIPVAPGGTIPFPATLINTSAQANFDISNTGSGAGQIKNVSLVAGSSSAFKLQGLNLFPQSLNAGQTLPTILVYSPTAVGTDTGQIQVTYGSGTTATFNLTGSGNSSTFTYQVIPSSGSPTTVSPNGTITLPDTAMGSTSSLIVQVINSGNAVGTVNSVNLTGQGFQLSNLPPILPSLKPNASFTFSITFTPTQPGPSKGQLAIGGDLFNLAGQGLGPQLGFSYTSSAGTTTTINTTNPSVVFIPLQVTQSEQLSFQVKNTGTLPATVSNLSIGETKSPFSISGQPPLPVTINPGDSFNLNVNFAPVLVGFTQGSLRVDTTAIPLTGTGTPPPSLPAYTFQGPSGNIPPQSQPGIGLTLSAPYPVDLAGILTLTTSGNLPSDTAVQFAGGLRTIPFVIPANSTNATFAGQGNQAFLQTGTVAETITLTPSFSTQAGGVPVTPDSPPTIQLTVLPAAPTLLTVQVASTTTTGFVLNVIGYSTTRKLTNLSVTFSPSAGFNVPSLQFPIDLSPVAPLWFQSAAAQTFGGQFEVAIPFTLQGTVATGQTLLQSLASVSVTASNDIGTSNSRQTQLQ
jgi:hypothetical protein